MLLLFFIMTFLKCTFQKIKDCHLFSKLYQRHPQPSCPKCHFMFLHLYTDVTYLYVNLNYFPSPLESMQTASLFPPGKFVKQCLHSSQRWWPKWSLASVRSTQTPQNVMVTVEGRLESAGQIEAIVKSLARNKSEILSWKVYTERIELILKCR